MPETFTSVEAMINALDEWDRQERSRPVRYFFRYTIRHWWTWYVKEPWYWLKCWAWHRHNRLILKDLPVTWTDRDTRLLHANFQILKEFIELERPYEHFNTVDSPRQEEWNELRLLYDWWETRRRQDSNLDDQNDVENQYEVDNKMLVRLIAVRHLLWT